MATFLQSNALTYRHRKEIVLTSGDEEVFRLHKEICDAAYKKEIEVAA